MNFKGTIIQDHPDIMCASPPGPYHVPLHEYRQIKNTDSGDKDICLHCSHQVSYPRRNNEIDEKKYIKDHMRDTLQPYGRTGQVYRMVYGEPKT